MYEWVIRNVLDFYQQGKWVKQAQIWPSFIFNLYNLVKNLYLKIYYNTSVFVIITQYFLPWWVPKDSNVVYKMTRFGNYTFFVHGVVRFGYKLRCSLF